MTRRSTGRPRTALLAATLLGAAALVLSGCSAGAVTQTDTTVSSVVGTEGQVGQVLLRNVTLDPGASPVVQAGSTVALRGTIINQALQDDQLVSVSTPYAGPARAEGFTTIVGNSSTAMVGADPVPVGPPSPTNPTASMRITLPQVSQVLHEGPTYPVTFTFARAGSVTLPVFLNTTTAVPAS
ncbi:copper chaperone PCu(A)C [Actinomycetospora chiangmaiensis]|uniref:copper chaperone PCu(A)C n=1 Tax=Actinomycetospora chiangmaiensis TaxID=402650 RepID=UPI00036F4B9A|nr:copper chaperone PCu(A)C [Actinomycetospora chiangmaiensis]